MESDADTEANNQRLIYVLSRGALPLHYKRKKSRIPGELLAKNGNSTIVVYAFKEHVKFEWTLDRKELHRIFGISKKNDGALAVDKCEDMTNVMLETLIDMSPFSGELLPYWLIIEEINAHIPVYNDSCSLNHMMVTLVNQVIKTGGLDTAVDKLVETFDLEDDDVSDILSEFNKIKVSPIAIPEMLQDGIRDKSNYCR